MSKAQKENDSLFFPFQLRNVGTIKAIISEWVSSSLRVLVPSATRDFHRTSDLSSQSQIRSNAMEKNSQGNKGKMIISKSIQK